MQENEIGARLVEEVESDDNDVTFIWDDGSYDESRRRYDAGQTQVLGTEMDEVVVGIDFVNSVPSSDVYSVHSVHTIEGESSGDFQYVSESAEDTVWPYQPGTYSVWVQGGKIVLVGEYVHAQKTRGIEPSMVVIDRDKVSFGVGRARDETEIGNDVDEDVFPDLLDYGGIERLEEELL